MKAAAFLGKGLLEEPEDLVQEALFRAISGARTCPVDTDILAFLYGVIRSLASAARKRGGSIRFVPLDDESVVQIADEADWQASLRAEQGMEHLRQRLLALFPERTYGRLVVTLKLKGHRGAQIMERTGLNRTQLATALRGIRRRVERAKRDGDL